MLKTSKVRLESGGVLSNLSMKDISNQFCSISVADYGVVLFNHNEGGHAGLLASYSVIVDDILVDRGGALDVKGWFEGRDFLLVKKSSAHIKDILKQIHFEGYDYGATYLKDYDKDYWSVSSVLPEPTTYGALVSASMGVAFVLRKRRRGALCVS